MITSQDRRLSGSQRSQRPWPVPCRCMINNHAQYCWITQPGQQVPSLAERDGCKWTWESDAPLIAGYVQVGVGETRLCLADSKTALPVHVVGCRQSVRGYQDSRHTCGCTQTSRILIGSIKERLKQPCSLSSQQEQ